jgi:hypothetical protein
MHIAYSNASSAASCTQIAPCTLTVVWRGTRLRFFLAGVWLVVSFGTKVCLLWKLPAKHKKDLGQEHH